MKHLEFIRSPKQALSVRDVNKPRTSRSTLSICGTPYFSGSYSPSTGVPPNERKITEALLFRFSTAKELLFLAFLVFYVTFGLLNKYWNAKTMTQLVTLSCNLVTQMIQTTQKTMHNQTLQKWATLSNTVTRYSLFQTLMSNALQYKASKGFRYIYYICMWCWGGGGGVRHNFWEIWRGVRANLRLLRWGYCVIFLLARLVLLPPPLLIIIAQSLIQ